QDLLLFGKAGLVKDEANKLQLSVNRRKRSDAIDGWQKQLDLNQEIGDFKFISSHFHLSNEQFLTSTNWLKSRSDLSFQKWKIVPGVIYEIDENEVTQQGDVISTLMNYRAKEFYLTNSDSTRSTY